MKLYGEKPTPVLERIATGNETWVRHFEPESKQEVMYLHKKGTLPLRRLRCWKNHAYGFWDGEGILLIDQRKNKGVLILQDNAPGHKSYVAMAALHRCGFELLVHLPHRPNLAPSDHYLFPKSFVINNFRKCIFT